jgi:hypothetical protein
MAGTISELFEGMIARPAQQTQQAQIDPALALAQMVGKPGAFAAYYGGQRNEAMANAGRNISDTISGGQYSSGAKITPDQLPGLMSGKLAEILKGDTTDPEVQAQALQIAQAINPETAVKLSYQFGEQNKVAAKTTQDQQINMAQRNSMAQLAISRGAEDLVAPILLGSIAGKDVVTAINESGNTKGALTEGGRTDLIKDFTSESVEEYLASDRTPSDVNLLRLRPTDTEDPKDTVLAQQVSEAFGLETGTPEHQARMQEVMQARAAGDRGDLTPAAEIQLVQDNVRKNPGYTDSISNIQSLDQAARGIALMKDGNTQAREGVLKNLVSMYNGNSRAVAEIDAWKASRNITQKFDTWVDTAISGGTGSEDFKELEALINDNLVHFKTVAQTALDSSAQLFKGVVSESTIQNVVRTESQMAGLTLENPETQILIDKYLYNNLPDYLRRPVGN